MMKQSTSLVCVCRGCCLSRFSQEEERYTHQMASFCICSCPGCSPHVRLSSSTTYDCQFVPAPWLFHYQEAKIQLENSRVLLGCSTASCLPNGPRDTQVSLSWKESHLRRAPRDAALGQHLPGSKALWFLERAGVTLCLSYLRRLLSTRLPPSLRGCALEGETKKSRIYSLQSTGEPGGGYLGGHRGCALVTVV